MATREISTKLTFDNTAEYKLAIREVNQELKAMNSDMKLLSSQYRENANSVEFLQKKQEMLKQQYDLQRAKVESLTQAYEFAKKQYGENSAKANEYKAAMNNAQIAVDKLNDEIDENSRYLSEAMHSADQCAASIDKYGHKVKSAKEHTDDAGKSSGRLADIFKGGLLASYAKQALDGVISKLKEMARAGIGLASDLQEVQNVVDTTFGDNAGKLGEWAASAKEQFGLSELAAKKYSSTLGSMLKSQGIYGDQLLEMSETLAGASADFASFYNLSTDEAFDKIRQAIGGETEGLKALGINLNTANLMQTEYVKSLGKTWNQMTMTEQAMARYNAILEFGADALGDFADTSDSFANQQKILQLNVEELEAALGEKLMPVASEFVETLNDLISGGDSAAVTMQKLLGEIEETNGVQDIIDRYRELSETVSTAQAVEAAAGTELWARTTDEVTDVATATEELNTVRQDLINASGGIITALDLENGRFDTQVEHLENLTQARRELAKTELLSIINDNVGSSAEVNLAGVESEIAAVTSDLDHFQSLYKDAKTEIEAGNLKNELGISYESVMDSAQRGVEMSIEDLEELHKAKAQVYTDQAAAEDAVRSLYEMGVAPQEIYAGTVLTLREVFDLLGVEVPEAMNEADEAAASMALQIQALSEAYEEAKIAAKESLDSTIGLWKEMDNEAVTSVEDVINALASQQEWLENYNANLEALSARSIEGVDTTALVQSLSDGSEESAAILAGLAEATDSEIAAIVESMQGIEAEKDALSETLAAAVTDLDAQMSSIVTTTATAIADMDQTEAAYQSGVDTLQGYIGGIESMRQSVCNKMSSVAQSAMAAWNASFDINSPSKKMEDSGVDSMKGNIIGVESMRGKLKDTYERSAYEAMNAFNGVVSNNSTVNNHYSRKSSVTINAQRIDEGMVDYICQRVNSQLGGAI